MMKTYEKHAAAGGLAALVGVAESYLYRPWDAGLNKLVTAPVRLLDRSGTLEELLHSVPDYFSCLGDVHTFMPHYFVTLGGALLGMALTGADRTKQALWAGAAVAVNILIELGQYFSAIPGGYETRDLLAGVAAGITAYAIAQLASRRSGKALPEKI